MPRLVIAGVLLALVAAACGDDDSTAATDEQATATTAEAPTTVATAATGLEPVALNDRIAFASVRDGNPEVYVMDADGSNVTRLTNPPVFDGFPVWSSDGTRIAFESGRDGNPEVYVMDADGSNVTRLTNPPRLRRLPGLVLGWDPNRLRVGAGRRHEPDADR